MKRHHTQLFIGLLLSAFFLWLAFRRVDFRLLWSTLRSINFWWFIPFVIITLLGMYVRAIRWKYFFLPRYHLSSKRLFPPLIVGFAFNGIFPARAGEFARAYLGARRENIGFSTMFATIVMERVFDGLTIIILFTLGLFFLPPFDKSISYPWSNRTRLSGTMLIIILSVILLIILVGLVLLFREGVLIRKGGRGQAGVSKGGRFRKIASLCGAEKNPTKFITAVAMLIFITVVLLVLIAGGVLIQKDRIYEWGKDYTINGEMLQKISKRTAIVLIALLIVLISLLINSTRQLFQRILLGVPLVPARIKEQVNHIIDKFAEGLEALQSWRALLMIIFYSFVVWILVGISLQVMSFGFPEVNMNFWQAMLIVIIICITISIPSAPGYWGLYEFGCLLAMSLLGIQQQREISLSFSLVIHSGQMFPIIAVGLYYFIKEQVSYEALTRQMENHEDKR